MVDVASKSLVVLSLGALACSSPVRAPEPAPAPKTNASVAPPIAPSVAAPGPATAPSAQAPGAFKARPYQSHDADIVSACAEFAQAYCKRNEQCAKVDFASRFGSRVSCVEQNTVWCAREMESKETGFTRESLASCRKAVASRACERFRRLEDLPIEACHPKGLRRFDEPCSGGAQCVSGFCKKQQIVDGPNEGLLAPCGTCAPVAAIDDRCAGPGAPFFGCPVGAMCSRGLCIGPFADEGEPCGAGAWYQTCYGTFPQDATPTNLVCDLHAPGRPICRRSVEPPRCAHSDDCWEGRFCDSVSKTCKPKRFVDAGEPCDNQTVVCKASAICRDTCVAPAKPGAPCDIDHACEWPATCVDRACVLLDPDVCDQPTVTQD